MQVVLIGSCQRQAKEGESQRWLSFFCRNVREKFAEMKLCLIFDT